MIATVADFVTCAHVIATVIHTTQSIGGGETRVTLAFAIAMSTRVTIFAVSELRIAAHRGTPPTGLHIVPFVTLTREAAMGLSVTHFVIVSFGHTVTTDAPVLVTAGTILVRQLCNALTRLLGAKLRVQAVVTLFSLVHLLVSAQGTLALAVWDESEAGQYARALTIIVAVLIQRFLALLQAGIKHSIAAVMLTPTHMI